MTLQPQDLYGRSRGRAVSVLEIAEGQPCLVRLPKRPTVADLYAGYHIAAVADLPEDDNSEEAERRAAQRLAPQQTRALLPAGRWQNPPFTPHQREIAAWMAWQPRPPEDEGGWNHQRDEGGGDHQRDEGGGNQQRDEGGWTTPHRLLDAWQESRALLDTPTLTMLRALRDTSPGAPPAEICHVVEAALAQAHRHLPGGRGPLAHLPVEVHPGIRLLPLRTPTLPPATHTNCYILGERDLIVVDPASPWDDERRRLDDYLEHLRSEGRQVRAILLTHHHGDHVGGAFHAARRWKAPIWAHPITAALLAPRIPVDRHLEEGELLTLPGSPDHPLRCLFTPGHAPGHLCLHAPQQRAIIAGDMIAGWGTIVVDPSEGDLSLYLKHLRRLAALGRATALPAHGPALADGPAVFGAFVNHRLRREAQLIDALSDGPASPADLTRRIYHDIPEWVIPAAQASVLAHLIKLESDGRIRASLDGQISLTP